MHTCSWFSSISVWRLRLGPGHGCHRRCWRGCCCFWGQLQAICPILLHPKQITSLTLFWALFGLATACPHLFPPGRKSSASANLAHVHPGEVSIGSYFGAPKGVLLGCRGLRGALNFSSHCLNPSCRPFRCMNRFCCSMAVVLQSLYMMSGGCMLYSSLYMLYGSPAVNISTTSWSLIANPA